MCPSNFKRKENYFVGIQIFQFNRERTLFHPDIYESNFLVCVDRFDAIHQVLVTGYSRVHSKSADTHARNRS